MTRFHVFLGAPTGSRKYESQLPARTVASPRRPWKTVVTNVSVASLDTGTAPSPTDIYKLSPTALDEASRRISVLYENIIFKDEIEPEDDYASPHMNFTTQFYQDQERGMPHMYPTEARKMLTLVLLRSNYAHNMASNCT